MTAAERVEMVLEIAYDGELAAWVATGMAPTYVGRRIKRMAQAMLRLATSTRRAAEAARKLGEALG